MQINDPVYSEAVTLYPQPLNGGTGRRTRRSSNHEQEMVDYLPGTSCRVWYTHLDHQKYPDHWHSALEIIMGEAGCYKVEVEGRSQEVQGGEILIIPPGTIHSLHPQTGCNGFILLLDISKLCKIKSAATIMASLTHPLYITKRNNPSLHIVAAALLSQMWKEYFSDNEMRELSLYSHLLTLLGELGKSQMNPSGTTLHVRPDKRNEYVDRFNEILYYINQHYMEKLTIDQLSRQFGLSKYYFTRLFKQYTQLTFCDYLANQRIRAAESLLSQPEMSITDIAYQTGFSSISTFSRVFKQLKNCTPSSFRRIYFQHPA